MLSRPQIAHCTSYAFNYAGNFQPQDARECHVAFVSAIALHYIAVRHAAGEYLHKNVVLAYKGNRHVLQFECRGRARAIQNGCKHSIRSPISSTGIADELAPLRSE
jgi:hypothetical protein